MRLYYNVLLNITNVSQSKTENIISHRENESVHLKKI